MFGEPRPGNAVGRHGDLARRPARDDPSTLRAGSRANVDDVVACGQQVEVVIYDNDRRARVHQSVEDLYQRRDGAWGAAACRHRRADARVGEPLGELSRAGVLAEQRPLHRVTALS